MDFEVTSSALLSNSGLHFGQNPSNNRS